MVCLEGLHFKNFGFVIAYSIQTGLAPRALALKKIDTRDQLHEIHEASQGVLQKHCFDTTSISCTKIIHHATGYQRIASLLSRQTTNHKDN
jgi:hypothetical protein